jgi:penicillin V acylase-like amidase (Ntn superfamily)
MRRHRFLALIAALGLCWASPAVQACSRVTWVELSQQVITGRSMDWSYGFHSPFIVIPRGKARWRR